MCGLVGIIASNMMVRHKEALSDLLYLDTWRGRDSTGVAALRHNADTVVLKSCVPGYEFIEGNKLDNHLKLNDFLWIGHNRFGTIGKNIKSNAHPFVIEDTDGSPMIVGAHNGTLKNKHVLQDHALYGTDSEALFYNIALQGVEAVIPQIEGAWALTWYDHNAEELRVLRNKERTLFYAYEEGKKAIIWASEIWMIRVVCQRRGIKIEEDKIFAFAEDTLHRIPAPDKTNEELTIERTGGLVGKQATHFFQNGRWTQRETGGGSNGFERPQVQETAANRPGPAGNCKALVALANASPSGTTTPGSGGTSTTTSKDSSGKPSLSSVVPIMDAKRYKGYAGTPLTRAEILSDLSGGCGWCDLEFITIDEKHAWLAPGIPICHKCLTGEHDDKEMVAAILGQVPKTATVH